MSILTTDTDTSKADGSRRRNMSDIMTDKFAANSAAASRNRMMITRSRLSDATLSTRLDFRSTVRRYVHRQEYWVRPQEDVVRSRYGYLNPLQNNQNVYCLVHEQPLPSTGRETGRWRRANGNQSCQLHRSYSEK